MPESQPKEGNQAAARDDERNGSNGAECTHCIQDAPFSGGEPGRSRCDPGSEVRPTARARRGRVCTAREPPAEMTRDLLVRDHLTLQFARAVSKFAEPPGEHSGEPPTSFQSSGLQVSAVSLRHAAIYLESG